MPNAKPTSPQDRARLGAVLRILRRARGLRPTAVAAAMGIAPRTYRSFETGGSQPTPERLRIFADLVDCDYAALLLASGGFSQSLVLASARNKAVTISVDAVEDLYGRLPTAFSTLTAAELMAAYDDASARLQAGAFETSRQRANEAETGAPISPRQLECLRWAQAGKSSTDIGAILGISGRTVDEYLAEACARFGVRTRIQAISEAIEAGLLSPRPP